jgi:hypothetical protein
METAEVFSRGRDAAGTRPVAAAKRTATKQNANLAVGV